MSNRPAVTLEGPEAGRLRVKLGNGPSKLVGGGATINEAARPELSSLSDFAGNPLKRVDLPVFFDGFRTETDVMRAHTENGVGYAGVQEILDLSQGGPKGQFPPPFVINPEENAESPIPYPKKAWLLELPDWGDGWRGERGQLIRQELNLHLIEFNNPADDVAKPHLPARGPGVAQERLIPHVVTLKHTETLLEVSVTYFGNTEWAKTIGKLNGIRDIRTIMAVGTKLRIPQGN